jgi:hypothetical protein
MSKQVYIYGLYDPITRELRYIGKTNDLGRRLWYHLRDARGGQKTYKGAWIRKLLREGSKPIISAIQETTEEEWSEDERKCIAQALYEGANLTNLTKGGEGIVNYSHSQETREKIRKYNLENGKIPPSWKGRKQSPEHIRKRVEARKKKGNYGHSEEAKKNISEGRKGRGLGNTNTLGLKQSEETKRKRSLSLRKFYKNNKKARKKISERMKGNKHQLGIKKSRGD